jgi:4-alpha-glucanotransferase
MLNLYKCNVGQVWTMQRIFIGEDLGFFSQSVRWKLEILWWKTLEFDIGEMNG